MKSDKWIKERALNGMIEPFIPQSVKMVDGRKVISFGLSCAGYDLRIAEDAYYLPDGEELIDPKGMSLDKYKKYVVFEENGDRFIHLKPGISLLSTVERVNMPRDATAFVLPKSTYSRCGVDVLNPLLEPEWCGNVTLSVVNHSNHWVKLYIGEALCQIVFQDTANVETSYEDRGGKYQDSKGVVVSRM